jgi:hypothetical protein
VISRDSKLGGRAFVADQFPDEFYRLVCAAAVKHRPITAQYDGAQRLLRPLVVGYNQPGEWQVFCYQSGGETKSGLRPDDGEGSGSVCRERSFPVKFRDGPWQSEPHARQCCVENIEIDAAGYPGGDPQDGQ